MPRLEKGANQPNKLRISAEASKELDGAELVVGLVSGCDWRPCWLCKMLSYPRLPHMGGNP